MTYRESAIADSRILRKCFGFYLSLARFIWSHLSASARASHFGRAYARHLNRMVRRHADRRQSCATFFLRNRPELQLLSRLLEQKPYGSCIDMSVLACSKGAEVYSMAWAIRSARPDLQLNMYAVDISQEMVDFASAGIYSMEKLEPPSLERSQVFEGKRQIESNTFRDQPACMFERMSREEIDAMFEVAGNQATVKAYLKEGITWICGDAASSSLKAAIGLQDIVVANRFLCHMRPMAADACLRNIAKMIRPGGYLFVSGVDLDVRTCVALETGLHPQQERIREIHDGDDSIRRGWPVEYWGLEPLDDRRMDWRIRYASVFKLSEEISSERSESSSNARSPGDRGHSPQALLGAHS